MIALIRRLIVSLREDGCPGPVPASILDLDVLSLAGTQRIQSGLPPETQRLWRAIAKEFPGVSRLGAWGDRNHALRKSCHNTGRAIDAMTTDPTTHAKLVAWGLAHRGEFGVTLIISRRQKWSKATGWKPAKYKGVSPHTDHIHFSVGC